ncbi:serine/threonine-protein phosphatase 4 regulatory subunit 4-like isoform X2 [Homarus americanus]|uniref:serine/threonine-protein phosphatase 4 regulatory subunit 4-like isoform X2 n=1 Tax=Homarus americanus TaxID=6706 RepID=UPI001C47BB2C|nr:serine/threonine-protein phosphatase 4 regulatory subunit 4-like isoform X2 [Homarus americanus]
MRRPYTSGDAVTKTNTIMKSPPLEGGEGPCEILQDAVHSGLSLLAGGGAGEGGGGIIGIESQGASQAPQEALSFLQGDLVPHTNFTHTFLKSILTSIDSKDPMVANAWLETLLDVIDLLPKEVIKDEILTLAVSKGQSQQVSARLAACKLIGKIATKFEPFLLKTEVVGVVQSLCQDVCGEVRGSMCSQLAAVARGLGLDATKTHILPELVDLCSDEETNVRLAGINTVVLMIPLLDDETRVGTLVPLVRKVCERALRVEDASLPVTAHLLGRICHGLHDELTEEQKSWFLNFYCTLAKLGLPDSKKTELPMPDLVAEVRSGEYEAECRQQCAYNLPCMVAFAGGSTTYRTSLHDTVSSLVTDPSQQVRTTVAAAFHQLCTLVSSEVGLLKEGLLQLLRSENLDILAALIPNLPHIITTMHRNNAITPQSPRGELMELVGAIKQGEETVSITSLWRVHAEALTQAAALAPCLPSDLIFTQLVPLMFIRMQTARPIPCRLAAARTLLVYLRHMNTSEHREHISNTLVSEFCEGNSCHKRMLFLNIATLVLEMFSKAFFKSYFFRPLLSLHSDRVANIRLKLVVLLPQMKATISLPEDKARLQELETVVGSLLMSESDRDVSAAISTTITQLDKIEVCECQRGSPEGDSGGQETEDERKERQERRVVNGSKATDKKSPDGNRSEGGSLGERRSGQRSSRRSSGIGRLPPYLERRRSNSHAPKQPPDEHTILRMSTLDPTTDEFLVDAGIRIDESVIKSRLPTPQSNATRISRWRPSDRPYASHLSSSNEGGSMDNKSRGSNNLGGSRLRQPSTNTSVSRIPAPPGTLGHQNDSPRGQDEQSSNHRDSQTSSGTRRGSQGGSGSTGSNVVTRLRPPSRPSRPVSTVASSPSRGPLPSRTKSLSHENLRTSPSRLALPTSPTVSPNSSRAASPHTSPQETENRPRTLNVIGSRLRQPQVRTPRNRGSRPTSCSSSPGGSRCSSPGLDGPVSGFGRGSRSGSRNGSTSSSPATSRCSSPAAEDLRSLSRGSQHRSSASVTRGNSAMSRSSRHTSGSTPEQVTTPPSPIPSPRTQRQGSSIPKPSSVSRGKPAGSKLPLPTSAKN